MSIYYCIADTEGGEVREGAVAVRSNMDVALPNSAGLYYTGDYIHVAHGTVYMTAVTVCMCMYIHQRSS